MNRRSHDWWAIQTLTDKWWSVSKEVCDARGAAVFCPGCGRKVSGCSDFVVAAAQVQTKLHMSFFFRPLMTVVSQEFLEHFPSAETKSSLIIGKIVRETGELISTHVVVLPREDVLVRGDASTKRFGDSRGSQFYRHRECGHLCYERTGLPYVLRAELPRSGVASAGGNLLVKSPLAVAIRRHRWRGVATWKMPVLETSRDKAPFPVRQWSDVRASIPDTTRSARLRVLLSSAPLPSLITAVPKNRIG